VITLLILCGLSFLAQPRSVQQLRHQPEDAFGRDRAQHPRDLGHGQDGRQARRTRAAQEFELSEVVARDSVRQHVPVEEHQRVQRLVLRGRREAALADEVVEKRFDVRRAQLLRRHPPAARGRGEREIPANPLAINVGRPP